LKKNIEIGYNPLSAIYDYLQLFIRRIFFYI